MTGLFLCTILPSAEKGKRMSNNEIPHGHKFDSGKPRFELIPISAYRLAAEIMTGGAKKYNENNWTGLLASRIIGAGFRHLNYYLSGQDYDKDSGQHHLGHFLANLLMLHHILNNFPSQDDRPYAPKRNEDTGDKHIYRESRVVTEIPHYTLLPSDSLVAGAEALTSIAKELGDFGWLGQSTVKTLTEKALHNYIDVVEGKSDNLGVAIAYTMILINEIKTSPSIDDRIFTYLEKE